MRALLRFFTLLLAVIAGSSPLAVMAQTPTLEFATGAGNPMGNGPSVANQVITFQNNADNPTASTFTAFAPAPTVTFALTNQQFTAVNSVSTKTGTSFGTTANGANAAAPAPLFAPLNNPFNYFDASTYTSTNKVAAGTGIAQASNYGVGLFNSVLAIPKTQSTAASNRIMFSTLTLTFSQPVVNPVIQVTDLERISS